MKKLIISFLLATSCVFAPAIPQNIVPNIHINQFGYTPAMMKIAVISNPQIGYNNTQSFNAGNTYQVRNWFTDEPIFEASTTEWSGGEVQAQSGDEVWWFDFSELQTDGSYYIYDLTNDAASGRFEIGNCVYTDLLKTAMRTFFYQRCGIEKNATYALTFWADGVCHNGNLQDTDCRLYNNQDISTSRNLSGGWHDAGDYNKYVNFAFDPVLDLCDAYEMHPTFWTDNYNIPESGNGQSDMLDELKYELEWLLKMQEDDGSVLSIVGATTYESASPPSGDVVQRVYGPATTASAYTAAALYARSALVFSGAFATTLQTAALSAWNWASTHPDIEFYNSGIIVSGEQQTSTYETWTRQLVAAIYLAELTNETTFHDFVAANYADAHLIQWSFAYPFETALQNALLRYASLPTADATVSLAINAVYSSSILDGNADNLPAFINQTDAYRAHLLDQNYTWGSNTTKARQGIMFQNMMNYNLDATNNIAYNEAALGFLHYFCGVNPNNVCFLTNINSIGAEHSCNTIYHAWFADGSAQWDQVGTSTFGPAPGFVQGGVNPTYALDGCCPASCGGPEFNALCDMNIVSPPMNQPVQKSWRDWNTGWPQNSWTVTEIGIYTQAAFIRLLSEYVTADCMNAVEVSEHSNQQIALHVFPNPCTDELVVNAEFYLPSEVTIEISDGTGRVVLSATNNSRSNKIAQIINTSELDAGIYFLRILSAQTDKTTSFLKMKN